MIFEGRCTDFHRKYSESELETLRKMSTRQLLKERNSLYYVSEFCADCHCQDDECTECIRNQDYNMEQVKALLATREHVPNKQESKALRKQRIKEGR